MPAYWIHLLDAFGGAAFFLILLRFFGKSIVEQFLRKDLESHKDSLKRATIKDVEEVRANLKILALEHSVKFTKLHEKRGEVIDKIYEALTLVYMGSKNYMPDILEANSDSPDKRTNYNLYKEATKKFYNIYMPNKIYLTENSCLSLNEFIKKSNLGVKIADMVSQRSQLTDIQFEVYDKSIKDSQVEMEIALKGLEKEFRELLGVKEE